ncbi:uncharacterized protein LOC125544880 [Triticum urartu]|uniref:uncharacterized protein LOC125544860 n=1 Tax=Triticum urartu TaxID=4572 RepID=UPI00204487B6|nr:uncharacterized protein LOC125544860 [Triticum urartu]XP_048564618.1 uncharacterized protein LOC125544880 [Triticum urartu]
MEVPLYTLITQPAIECKGKILCFTYAYTRMKKGGGKASGCFFCLGAPIRALSRACDLYVNCMSGCARRMPAGAVVGGRGFGGPATSMHLRASSDRSDGLVRAASKQRRVAPEPAEVGAAKKTVRLSQAPAAVPARRKGPAMVTIDEDAPCEFGACPLKRPEQRSRGAAVGGLAARGGGFGAIKVGGEAFESRP